MDDLPLADLPIGANGQVYLISRICDTQTKLPRAPSQRPSGHREKERETLVRLAVDSLRQGEEDGGSSRSKGSQGQDGGGGGGGGGCCGGIAIHVGAGASGGRAAGRGAAGSTATFTVDASTCRRKCAVLDKGRPMAYNGSSGF